MFDELRRLVPKLRIERRDAEREEDRDVYVLSDAAGAGRLRVDSHRDGRPPFLVEDHGFVDLSIAGPLTMATQKRTWMGG